MSQTRNTVHSNLSICSWNKNTKTIENKHFIHYLKRFPQTLSACFVMLTSQRNYISVFYCCPKFQCFSTFSRIVECFHYKLSSVWSYIFLFKWPRQEAKTKPHQNKTTFTRSKERSPTNHYQLTRLFLARCHRDFVLIG